MPSHASAGEPATPWFRPRVWRPIRARFRERQSAKPAPIPSWFGPPVSQNPAVPKRAGRTRSEFPNRIAALYWSGRQDSNLRPPGPELLSGSWEGVTLSSTGSHPLDITEDSDPAHPLNGRRDRPCEAGFVPPVSPRFRRKLILSERLLSIREAAERLSICRASLYKLCAQNQVAHVRIGNAIRFAPADLDAFLRAYRRPRA